MRQVDLSPVEHEMAFSKWTRDKKVECVLLDLDDTICKTRGTFDEQVWACTIFLEQRTGESGEEWFKRIRRHSDALYETVSVNPRRWELVMEAIGREHNLDDQTKKKGRDILMATYEIETKFLPGAEEGLKFLKKTETPIRIVTHANKEWTWRKYGQLRLERFLDWDDVWVVDQDGHKGAKEWGEAVKYFGTTPEKCAAVGDSPRSDMLPTEAIGVRHRFLIENTNVWSVQAANVSEKTQRIRSLQDMKYVGTNEYLFSSPQFRAA